MVGFVVAGCSGGVTDDAVANLTTDPAAPPVSSPTVLTDKMSSIDDVAAALIRLGLCSQLDEVQEPFNDPGVEVRGQCYTAERDDSIPIKWYISEGGARVQSARGQRDVYELLRETSKLTGGGEPERRSWIWGAGVGGDGWSVLCSTECERVATELGGTAEIWPPSQPESVDPDLFAKDFLVDCIDAASDSSIVTDTIVQAGLDSIVVELPPNLLECLAPLETRLVYQLGFSSSIVERIRSTRAFDGELSASAKGWTTYWRYHPDSGLSMILQTDPGGS